MFAQGYWFVTSPRETSASDFRSLPDLPENFGNDWLSNAQEIILPETVSYLPQTSGWLWVWGLCALIGCCVGYAFWQRYQRTLYVRQALQRLLHLNERLAKGEPEVLAELPELLKRVAFSAWPRADLVPLESSEWLMFWSRTAEDRVPELINTASYLNSHALSSVSPHDRLAAMNWARHWIRQHRRFRLHSVAELVDGAKHKSASAVQDHLPGDPT